MGSSEVNNLNKMDKSLLGSHVVHVAAVSSAYVYEDCLYFLDGFRKNISEKNIEIAFFLFKIVFLPVCSDYLSLPTKEFSSIVCVQRKTRNGYDIPSIENSLALARD